MEMHAMITVFQNEMFGRIRVIEEAGNTLFCGADVARALGYSAPRNAIQRHCKGALKRCIPTESGNQTMLVLTEGDVYRLIAHSKLPAAEAFEHWVFDEVLPALRKDGYYATERLLRMLAEKNQQLSELNESAMELLSVAEELEARAAIAEPKAAYYDAFVSPAQCTNIRNTAKELQIPEKQFITFMRCNNYLYRSADGSLLPYADKLKAGFFAVRDFCRNGHSGCYTLITPCGKQHFLKKRSSILEDENIWATA